MDYNTKRKIKQFFKEKWKWLVSSAAFLTAGLVIMLIGMKVSGWSIIKWLQSPFATTSIIFIVGGVFLLVMAFLIKKQLERFK